MSKIDLSCKRTGPDFLTSNKNGFVQDKFVFVLDKLFLSVQKDEALDKEYSKEENFALSTMP